MKTVFDPGMSLIVVDAELQGPIGTIPIRLALDTGATTTVINHAPLIYVGYYPGGAPERVQVTMGGGVNYSPLIQIERIEVLGQSRDSLAILAHTLPPSASVDGLLGLDSFRNRRLTIDFNKGEIDLA